MRCIKVKKSEAEKVRRELMKAHALAKSFRPIVGRTYIYFPVATEIPGYKIVDKKTTQREKEKVDVGAYDQVGDIVILPEEGTKQQAEQLLKQKAVKVVLRRKGIHSGEFRTQDLEWVAGEKRKETVYRENGVQMKVDVEKCYFSPRLSTERMRIAKQVKPGERVLVLFSGVGPYQLVIAKHAKPALIVGVEKNPAAHKYAVENCKKYPNIELYNADAHAFTYKKQFDRVLMPLPYSGEEFLQDAARLTKKGGIVHFYDFATAEEIPKKSIDEIQKRIPKAKVLKVTKCGQYGPQRWRICVDFKNGA